MPGERHDLTMIRAVPLFMIAAAFAASAETAPSEADKEIPIGLEAVTGFRSESIWRGFKLGDGVLDFQLQAEIALSNEWRIDTGGYYATETGDGDFSQSSFFIDLMYDADQFSAGISVTLQSFDHAILQDGVDIAPSISWHATKDLDVTFGAAYDTGAEAPYVWLETEWTQPVTDSSFVSLKAGTSWVDDYYGRSGWNDVYGRASFTYAISKSVSVTPFVGFSLPMDASPETERLFGGVWFEVNF
ncbi:MAG: hypothetical protein CFE26_09220 [Verrucomicrobiales bacterium VVV1]|nr:MAG: hypothetical protein CFE26_09220 [Verrucomicrobiales bacterium VVV1]